MLNTNYTIISNTGDKTDILAINAKLALVKHCLRKLGYDVKNEGMFKRELELRRDIESKITESNGYLKVYNFSVKINDNKC